MWTTYDGDHSATSLVSVSIVGVGGICARLFPSQKYNASIVGRPIKWNTSLCHKWDTSGLCLKESHYDMPLDVSLSKDCPNNIVRGICFNLKWLLQFW